MLLVNVVLMRRAFGPLDRLLMTLMGRGDPLQPGTQAQAPPSTPVAESSVGGCRTRGNAQASA